MFPFLFSLLCYVSPIVQPSLSPSPPYLSCLSAISQSKEHFKCVWGSWLITACVLWFVNVEQLIVVWKSSAAGGQSIINVYMCVHVCLSVSCLTVLNTGQMGINTSSLSLECLQTWVTSPKSKTHTVTEVFSNHSFIQQWLITDQRCKETLLLKLQDLCIHTHTQNTHNDMSLLSYNTYLSLRLMEFAGFIIDILFGD